MKKHVDIRVAGNVQGVGFRYAAKEAANTFGVFGYAKNMPDGTVALEIEGDEDDLERFLDWCRSGSASATIENIDIQNGEIKNYRDFQVF